MNVEINKSLEYHSFLLVMISALAFVILLLFSWSWLKHVFLRWFLRLPRGPWGLPIVGNLHQLGPKPHETFTRWARRYGDVFTAQIGPKTVLVLNSFGAASEALVKHGKVFNHRAPTSLLRIEAKGLGILNNEGPIWTEHRRFTLSCLKNKGFGKGSIEAPILDEISELISDLEKYDGHLVDPRNHLTMSVANILWSIVAGHRFKRGDRKLMELADMNDAVVRTIGNVGLMTFFPQLRFIFRRKYMKFHDAMENLRNFLNEEIKNHRNSESVGTCLNLDLVDEFLAEAEREKNSGGKITFTDQQICAILLDLFVAGVETSVTTLRWSILLLLQHPEVQQEIQREIDDVIGIERLPSNEDRTRMPYTEAAIAEIQRYACVIPTFFHCLSEDTEFRQYNIAKHTPVLINNWGIHRDPSAWDKPDVFNVNRFLDEEGHFKKMESFMPFGLGRRSCPGESLARIELFLFLMCLLQKFEFIIPDGVTLPTNTQSGLVMAPESFQLIFRKR